MWQRVGELDKKKKKKPKKKKNDGLGGSDREVRGRKITTEKLEKEREENRSWGMHAAKVGVEMHGEGEDRREERDEVKWKV